MKKYIFVLVAFIACLFAVTDVSAQKRSKIKDGVYLVSYGNTYIIEDDNSQQSKPLIKLSVERREDKSGRPVYDILCGNKYTKDIAKTSLKLALSSVITSAAAAIGGAVGGASTGGAGAVAGAAKGAAIGGVISSYATSIASNIYDDVCNYYKD